MSFAAGARLGPYEIVAPLGAGGMGEVFRARDTRLEREVAIKVLRSDVAADAERRRRFNLEARAVSRLNHPGIVTLHEIESVDGPDGPLDFLVMELVPGESLDRRLGGRLLPVDEAIDLGLQMAEALAAAHAAGVVHRDLKPANLMVTENGRLKILDFGLARLERAPFATGAPTQTADPATGFGAVMGTAGYWAPEQATGKRADERSDLFSLGVVLFEMLAGTPPFRRDSAAASLAAVLQEPAPKVVSARADVPGELSEIVAACLEKDPARRPESAEAVGAVLRRLRATASQSAPASKRPRWLRAGLVFGGVAAAAVVWIGGGDARWVRDVAVPQLERLIVEDDLFEAFVLAREIERRAPGNPALARLWPTFANQARLESQPSGAAVEIKDYASPDADWIPVGQTPVDLYLPVRPFRARVTSPGHATVEAAPSPVGGTPEGRLLFSFLLYEADAAPSDMVRVGGSTVAYRGAPTVAVDDFWIDRVEVTNRRYQEFVDDGGYGRRELWPHPVVHEGRTVPWEEATRRLFVDATGRPGPSTWELGRFIEGAADHPVTGVSWYEASAFAAWAGLSLPTFHHWYRAAQPDVFSEILSFSRIGGEGPVQAGSLAGLGPWGTMDMAGNVKEWVSTDSGVMRYALGGAWSDPPYLYSEPEAFPPARRTPEMGFRCARFDRPPAAEVLAAVRLAERDYSRVRPVADEVFAALTSAYSYDTAAPLAARSEHVDDVPSDWRVERVSIAAAYAGERVPILLFLPKHARPPYAAVVYFPESTAEATPSTSELQTRWFEFIVRSGRAVIVPIYKNFYERRPATPPVWSPTGRRDLVIAWSKDFRRTIDYLSTREDLDAGRVAFYGFSLGAVYGPVLTALEPRLKAAVLLGGGLPTSTLLPEADPVNFAPRVRAPTLMVAGREDFVRPVETMQRPLFNLIGVPPEAKRLAVLDGGHLPPRLTDTMREVLDWLDRWLGPVTRR